jgi:hypothetical protein
MFCYTHISNFYLIFFSFGNAKFTIICVMELVTFICIDYIWHNNTYLCFVAPMNGDVDYHHNTLSLDGMSYHYHGKLSC